MFLISKGGGEQDTGLLEENEDQGEIQEAKSNSVNPATSKHQNPTTLRCKEETSTCEDPYICICLHASLSVRSD